MTLTLAPLRSAHRRQPLPFDPQQVRTLFCDAEGTLFPSTEGDEEALRPDPDVLGALTVLDQRFTLALVTGAAASGARRRLQRCGMAGCFSDRLTFGPGHQDDTYRRAGAESGTFLDEGLAVVASAEAARAATAAGFPAVGNLQYVAPEERPERQVRLVEAGASAVVTSWEHLLVTLLD